MWRFGDPGVKGDMQRDGAVLLALGGQKIHVELILGREMGQVEAELLPIQLAAAQDMVAIVRRADLELPPPPPTHRGSHKGRFPRSESTRNQQMPLAVYQQRVASNLQQLLELVWPGTNAQDGTTIAMRRVSGYLLGCVRTREGGANLE